MFETLSKSDVINFQNNLTDLISNSYGVKAALWQFYGKSEMASLWSQLLFYLNIDSPNDNKTFYGESFCLCVCNIANHLLVQGNYSIVCTVLGFAKERFPNEPHSLVWMMCENLFIFTRSLYHENWTEAQIAAQKILVVDKWEGYLRLAEYFYFKQDYSEAHRFIEILIDKYESTEKNKVQKIGCYVRAKILLAQIQFSCNHPGKVPPGVITLLNDCLMLSEKYHLNYHSAMIHLHIANVQLSIGLFAQALRILDRCLLQILAHGGHFDRARAMLLYAKCLIADSVKFDTDKRTNILLEVAQMLERIKKDFQAVEAYSRVKDVLFLQV